MTLPNGSATRFVALQSRDFRLLWYGQAISTVGSQMQLTAINWHIYNLLRGDTYTLSIFGHTLRLGAQALGLGTLGLVRIVPIVLFALLGGVVADVYDRRRLMIWTQTVMALLAGVLAVLTVLNLETVGVIYLITAGVSAATAFDSPARQSLVPNLVPREHLTNALSLSAMMMETATIAGPAIGGLIIAAASPGVVYALNALSFFAVIVALLLMQYRGARAEGMGKGLGWDALVEGLHFTYRSRIIWSTMLLDFFATFFSSARTMLPIIAGDLLHVGAGGYGVLSTAQSAGSLIAGLIMSSRRDIYRQGAVLLISVAIYGVATALFGVSTIFVLSYLLYAATGAADTVSMVIRQTIRQLMTPDRLRGRMTSVNMMFFMGGPQLGELEAGVVASALGVPFSIVSGGVATVLLTAWVAWQYPRLRTYTSDTAAEFAAHEPAPVEAP
jgi:MFS family permease